MSEKNRHEIFAGQKRAKTAKRTRFQAKIAEVGCVLGAGGGGSGWEQVRTDGKTKCLNQSEPHSHTTRAKRKPAKTQCFRRFCGRGRRTWSRLPPRVLLPGGERPAPTEAGAETGAAERHRWPALLGTRFWSGCGRTQAREGKARCCPVLRASQKTCGAGLVL